MSDQERPGATMHRQGDVLLVSVGTLPREAAPEPTNERGEAVLMMGEATGHSHAVREDGGRIYAAGKRRYLHAVTAIAVVHEEHDPIHLVPGVYRIVQQREYVGLKAERRADRELREITRPVQD